MAGAWVRQGMEAGIRQERGRGRRGQDRGMAGAGVRQARGRRGQDRGMAGAGQGQG